jgi:hypothetical protein
LIRGHGLPRDKLKDLNLLPKDLPKIAKGKGKLGMAAFPNIKKMKKWITEAR